MEKWKEVYSENQLKTVQSIEMKNFSVMLDVCRKLNVNCFAYGGTLLGAVRHQGFIPWDDDLDLAMPRADYMRFVKEAGDFLPKEYYLQTPYSDSKSPFPYVKLRLRGTKYIEKCYEEMHIEQGIYIDIYPIDSLPSDKRLMQKLHRIFNLLSKAYSWRQCPYICKERNSFSAYAKQIVKFIISSLLKLIPRMWIIYCMDKIGTKYNSAGNTGVYGNYFYPTSQNVFSSVFPLKEGIFEGNKIMLPNTWETHLASRYGDFMQLPIEEKRIGHRPTILEFGIYQDEK